MKPAGAVEPAVVEADRTLTSGSADALVNLLTSDVASGIRERFERAAAAYKPKDVSVTQGREFVDAYVEFMHYVERLHLLTTATVAHGEHDHGAKHFPPKHPRHSADKE